MRLPLPFLATTLALAGCQATGGEGRAALNSALEQQSDPQLWMDVPQSAQRAALLLDEEGETAGAATARAVAEWQKALEGDESVDPDALVRRLAEVAGSLPETSRLLTDIQFEVQDLAGAADALEEGLRRWPEDEGLHRIARDWAHVHPDPQRLLDQLGKEDPETRALLTASLAQSAYDGNRLEEAARLFEEAADLFPENDFGRRADVLSMAGWSRYYDGLNRGGELLPAEADFVAALRAMPTHEQAALGVGSIGNALVERGELESARDFFGRVAPLFRNADWWNNHAFLCRETGQYEQSYEAYRTAIAIQPDDARMVNDTGLILLYHLNRDLDQAEQLFRRAWELGKKACSNPFADEESRTQNFEAYTDAMLNLGYLLHLRGERAEARKIVDELLQIAPDRPDARELRETIDEEDPS